MCECGCQAPNGQWQMPGPDGKTYVLGVYDSCFDCDTPAGVDIVLHTADELKEYGYDELPVIDVSQPQIGIAVLHWRSLAKGMKNFFIGDAPLHPDEVDDMLRETFRDAIADTGKDCGPCVVDDKKGAG